MDYSKLTLGELLSSFNQAIKRNAIGILKQLQKNTLKDYYAYKTAKHYENHLKKNGKSHDAVIVGKILFTMDEYDMEGKTITYGNLKHKKMLTIETSNRYGITGFKDANVWIDDLSFWRNDITYIE